MAPRTKTTGKIASAQGVVPATGYESTVDELLAKLPFFNCLKSEVDGLKDALRDAALALAEQTVGVVRQVEFLSKHGTAPVTLMDPEKDGNRTQIKSEDLQKLIELGAPLDSLGVAESVDTITLSGPLVQWFRDTMAASYANGVVPAEVSENYKEATVTRLSAAGVARLRQLLEAEDTPEPIRAAATYLLRAGIKSPSVSVKHS